MIRNFVSKLLLLSCAMFGVLELNAQSVLIPTTAISTIPVATMDNISEGRKEFVILQTITASASVNSDNKRGSRTIWEADNEFKLIYDIKKEGGRRYLEYEDCIGVLRLGYLGSTDVYSSEANFLPAEEIVRRLALYRLINLAKEYGADALITPTITTTATSSKKELIYRSEVSAKIVKIKND